MDSTIQSFNNQGLQFVPLVIKMTNIEINCRVIIYLHNFTECDHKPQIPAQEKKKKEKKRQRKKQWWEIINLPMHWVQERSCSVSTCCQLKEKSSKTFSEHAGQWLSHAVGVAILSPWN